MKRNKITVLLIALTLIVGQAFANNITIDSNPQPVNEDTANQYMDIQFDISWDNSWRTDTATLTPNWWDAAWVFVKYKIGDDGTWKHCHLSATAGHHSITTDNGVGGSIEPVADSMGVFMYRSSGGNGSNDWDGVQLRWYYGSEPDVGTDYIEFKVFALEMVYVPEGAFYVGDSVGNNSSGQLGPWGRFCQANDSTTPYLITSEIGFWLGGTLPENLNAYDYDAGAGIRPEVDDFNNTDSVLLSDNYPKGYNDFYMMKHELSQIGYVDFLNTLTRTQQNARTATDISGTNVTNVFVMTNTANINKEDVNNAICCESTLPSSPNPIQFYCDYDEDGVYNEDADGMNLALNFINFQDMGAYMDWAGLRPMSDLEYEKASRGTLYPVKNEYAWGGIDTTHILSSTGYSEAGSIANPVNSNFNALNIALGVSYKVCRPGQFARASSSRVLSGSSYYGIQDLTGNVMELIVSLGNPEGRAFGGEHGDGSIQATGYYDVDNWPTSSSLGSGARGGSFNEYSILARISNRYFAVRTMSFRHRAFGARGVRATP